MLAAPQQPAKPQQARQQAGGASCAAPSALPFAWAAAAPALQPPEQPVQLLPGFHLWLCMGRPSLQLFWQPGGLWVAGFSFAPSQALPVMAAPSQEALVAAAASAQGLVPLDPAPSAAAALNQSVAAAAAAAGEAVQQASDGHAAPAAAAGDGEAAAGGKEQVLCRASRADSLSCSEQLSQGLTDGEAAGQQAESTAVQPMPAAGSVGAAAQLPSQRKRLQEAEAQPGSGAILAAGGETEAQACAGCALPAKGPAAAAAGSTDGRPAAKRRALERAAAEQAAAARAVGLATAAGKQSPQPSWLPQPAPAAAGPASAPSAAEAAAEAKAALAAAQAAASAGAAAAAQRAVVHQSDWLAPAPAQHPALSHESHCWQQLDRGRSASPAKATAAAPTATAAGGGAAGAVRTAALAPYPGLPLLPALHTARGVDEGPAAAERVPEAGPSSPTAAQCSEDEVAAAEMLQALAAAAGGGSTALEPLSPLSPQRGAPVAPAPELSSLSSSRSALHAHLQPCGTAVEATAPTWVTFHLPADALGGPTGSVTLVRCRFLFQFEDGKHPLQKPLSASDAGRLGRMVMPRCAEHYLSQPEGPEGLVLDVLDPAGCRYQWLLKFWLSHAQTASGGPPKRTYVFEGCRAFQLAWQVAARTTLAFYRLPGGGYLVDPHAVETHFSSVPESERHADP